MKKRKKGTTHATARHTQPARKPKNRKPPAVKSGPLRLLLPAECLVSSATALRHELAELIHDARAVTLDVTALQRIDTSALQVLVAFMRERDLNALPVQWQGTSTALSNAAHLLGLESLLGLQALA